MDVTRQQLDVAMRRQSGPSLHFTPRVLPKYYHSQSDRWLWLKDGEGDGFRCRNGGRHLSMSAASVCRLGIGWHWRCWYVSEGQCVTANSRRSLSGTFTLNLSLHSFLKKDKGKKGSWLRGGDSGRQVGRKGSGKQQPVDPGTSCERRQSNPTSSTRPHSHAPANLGFLSSCHCNVPPFSSSARDLGFIWNLNSSELPQSGCQLYWLFPSILVIIYLLI